MKRFKDLVFIRDEHLHSVGIRKYYASTDIGTYSLSVIYGDSCYGNGHDSDTFEVSVYQGDDVVPLESDTDVSGWMTSSEIDCLMKILHDEPLFGESCKVFKRTNYNKRFSRICELTEPDTL